MIYNLVLFGSGVMVGAFVTVIVMAALIASRFNGD